MDLIDAEWAVAEAVGTAELVAPVGTGTHHEAGGPPPVGTPVRAPSGVVAYDPADLTVTVGAGTTVAELADVLADRGQECVLEPRDPGATIGGTIACGLSGPRRLRYGPLRDRVLEVRFASAGGRLVRGGGPTVKNVTGYDLPRLLVGSFGTIGVLTRVILRCQPLASAARWFTTDRDPAAVHRACTRPSSVLWDGTTTWVLLEGHPGDVDAQARAAALRTAAGSPPLPEGPHRGRASVNPGQIFELGARLAGARWLAEVGVGTVHVATDDPEHLSAARTAAERIGGWMLREAGAPALSGFGSVVPNAVLMAHIKAAFDPTNKLAPGRLPITQPLVEAEVQV